MPDDNGAMSKSTFFSVGTALCVLSMAALAVLESSVDHFFKPYGHCRS